MARLGIEATRRRLPELVAAAHQGITTIITKHGKPYAALVPVNRANVKQGLPTSLLALKGSDFIVAERAIGASPARIALLHLLPNVAGPLIILCSMDIPVVMMMEAGFGYLGLGVRPPTASWGTILSDAFVQLERAPWFVVIAGTPLVLATLGFTFLGEGLRDALDPKLQLRRAI